MRESMDRKRGRKGRNKAVRGVILPWKRRGSSRKKYNNQEEKGAGLA